MTHSYSIRIPVALVLATMIAGVLLASAPLTALADEKLSNKGGLEVLIKDRDVIVRGASVTSISGNIIQATTAWGQTSINWTVTTASSTKFFSKDALRASIADIGVGDIISFSGRWNASGAFNVMADVVRDWTHDKKGRAIQGEVKSVSTTSNSLTIGRPESATSTLTIQLTADASIMVNGATTTLASVKAGDHIKAVGVFNAGETVFTASALVVRSPGVFPRLDILKNIRAWFKGEYKGEVKDRKEIEKKLKIEIER